jgi:hypothetical protein
MQTDSQGRQHYMPESNDPGDKDPFKAGLIYERLSGIRVLNRCWSRLTLDSVEVVPMMKNLND